MRFGGWLEEGKYFGRFSFAFAPAFTPQRTKTARWGTPSSAERWAAFAAARCQGDPKLKLGLPALAYLKSKSARDALRASPSDEIIWRNDCGRRNHVQQAGVELACAIKILIGTRDHWIKIEWIKQCGYSRRPRVGRSSPVDGLLGLLGSLPPTPTRRSVGLLSLPLSLSFRLFSMRARRALTSSNSEVETM